MKLIGNISIWILYFCYDLFDIGLSLLLGFIKFYVTWSDLTISLVAIIVAVVWDCEVYITTNRNTITCIFDENPALIQSR